MKKTVLKISLSIGYIFFNIKAMASSTWGNKVTQATNAGAQQISSILDGVTSLLMAVSGIMFLVGIITAGIKYKGGDQHAYKNLQGVLIGSLVVLVGVGLCKALFFS